MASFEVMLTWSLHLKMVRMVCHPEDIEEIDLVLLEARSNLVLMCQERFVQQTVLPSLSST